MGYYFAKGAAASSYSTEVLADSPVGYWRLGESSGTNAADSSGNGNNGTYENTPTLAQTGAVTGDTAVLFARASSQRVALAQPAILRVTGQFTMECWYKPTTFPTGTDVHALIERGYNSGNGKQGFALRVSGNSGTPIVYAGAYESSTEYAVSWTIAGWSTGEWRHIAAGWDGTDWKIFVNGTEVASAAKVAGANDNSRAIYIGCLDQGFLSDHANGTIDEVALYDTWLGSTRIAAHATTT